MLCLMWTLCWWSNCNIAIFVFRTRWGTNPLTLGSYSFVKVGSSQRDIQELGEPLRPRGQSKVRSTWLCTNPFLGVKASIRFNADYFCACKKFWQAKIAVFCTNSLQLVAQTKQNKAWKWSGSSAFLLRWQTCMLHYSISSDPHIGQHHLSICQ
jgi:hypothetical protein